MRKRKAKLRPDRRKAYRFSLEPLEGRDLLTGFTAYNTFLDGPNNHPNTTMFADAPSRDASGQLIDSRTGQLLNARVTVTEVGSSIWFGGKEPFAATPAHEIFDGFVDFDGPSRRTIGVQDDDVYQYTFENLDAGALYEFAGTAIAGAASFTNRWALLEIVGADSFDADHLGGDGVVTSGLDANQVAIWTGDNAKEGQGVVAQWTNIDPGPDGSFTVISSQYAGSVPRSIDSDRVADGSRAYAISTFRLVEQGAVAPPVVSTTEATEISALSASLNGEVPDSGGQLPAITVFYGKTDGATDPRAWENSAALDRAKNFSLVLDDLEPETQYFYRAFGANDLGADWGETVSFTTLSAAPPTLAEPAVLTIGGERARLQLEVENTGNDAPILTLFYGEADAGQSVESWSNSVELGLQDGSLEHDLTELSELTEYFFSVRAINEFGQDWTESRSFTTTELPALLINEVMTDNSTTLETRVRARTTTAFRGDTMSPDWIEIYNTRTSTVDLSGYWLTDDLDSPTQWQFPANTIIEPKDYLVVFASGFNLTNPNLDEQGNLHASFQLSSQAGAEVGIFDPDEMEVFSIRDMPGQSEDIAFGVSRDLSLRQFATPTPGGENSLESPAAPTIMAKSQAFQDDVRVEIVPANSNHQIFYTVDESEPTEDSTPYREALVFSSSTHLRAISVAPNGEKSVVVSESYVAFSRGVANDETHLPILIVETFGDNISSSGFGDDFVAIIEPNADGVSTPMDEFTLATRAGVRIRGSSSAGFAKKQYRVEFRDENNEDRKLPVLGMPKEADWIFYGPGQYDRSLIANPLIYDLSNQMGRYAVRTRWVEAYFNGRYFGLYAIMETIEVDGDRVDVGDLSAGSGGTDVEGGFIWKNDRGSAFHDPEVVNTKQRNYITGFIDDLESAAASRNREDPDVGYAAHADVPSFIDHNILNLLPMNVDAFRLSSYYHKSADGKLAAGPIWDFDRSMSSTDNRDNNPRTWYGTGDSSRPFDDSARSMSWWENMADDPNYMSQYIDRWFELRRTVLSTENIDATIDKHVAEIGEAANRNFGVWSAPRFGGFDGEIRSLKTWLQRRVDWIDSQWMDRPESDAASDRLPVGTQVNIQQDDEEESTVYYMLDGTDPRLPGGDVHPDAKELDGPITIESNTQLFARTYDRSFGANNGYVRSGDDWSAPLLISPARQPADASNLAITEIHFNPRGADVLGGEENEDNDEFEFIELTNIGDQPIELEGVRFEEYEIDGDSEGIRFNFSAQVLDPGESIVVAENVDAFRSRYGAVASIAAGVDDTDDKEGQYGGKLSNGGEWLSLLASDGSVIRQFEYDDWFPNTDGLGYSLVIRNPSEGRTEPLNRQGAWRSSTELDGTPGVGVPPIKGDFNGDRQVDSIDVDMVYAAISGGDLDRFDLTDDGKIDRDDITFMVEQILGAQQGDLNLDGEVAFVDFLILSTNFGSNDPIWSKGDLDADGDIGFADFLILSANFGAE